MIGQTMLFERSGPARNEALPQGIGSQARNDDRFLLLALAVCCLYLLWPSMITAVIVVLTGGVLVIMRPSVSAVFLAFGWVAQRQLVTYWSGVPLLGLGLFGGLLQARGALPTLLKDPPFRAFFAVSSFFVLVSVLYRPEWDSYITERVMYMVVGVAVYLLCVSQGGRRYYRVAAVAAGLAVALNAIYYSHVLGMAVLRTGDVASLKLNDSNYASIPVVFAGALVLERLMCVGVPEWMKGALLAALGLMVFGLLTLASRGGQLAMSIVLAVWLLMLWRNGVTLSRRARAALLLSTVGIVAFVISSVVSGDMLLVNQARWTDALPSAGSDRLYIYQAALDFFRSHPSSLLGSGIGFNLDALGISTHNQLLDTLFDYGVVGVLSLFWLWARFFNSGGRRNAQTGEVESTLLPALGLAVASFTLSPIWFPFFWVQIGYLAATSNTAIASASADDLSSCDMRESSVCR